METMKKRKTPVDNEFSTPYNNAGNCPHWNGQFVLPANQVNWKGLNF